MRRIDIHDSQSMQWIEAASIVPASVAELLSPEELGSELRFHEPGDAERLQLFEVRFKPDASVDLHAHDEDEIIYVVEGSLVIGARELGPGSSVFIAGQTLYQFSAGKQGLRMVNFRPVADKTYITKDEFIRRKSAAAAAST